MKTYAHIDENGFVFATVTSENPVPQMAGKGLEVHNGEASELAGKVFDKAEKRYFEPKRKKELVNGKEFDVFDLVAGKPKPDKTKEIAQKAEWKIEAEALPVEGEVDRGL